MNKEKLEHVAEICRIKISEEEMSKAHDNISEIMDFIKKIDSLDVGDTLPMIAVHDFEHVFRKDDVEESLPVSMVLENTEEQKFGYFSMIRVVE